MMTTIISCSCRDVDQPQTLVEVEVKVIEYSLCNVLRVSQ